MKLHRSMQIATIAPLLFVFSNMLYAQDVCEAFAKYGIYDTQTTTSDTDKASSFRSWFCQSKFESKESANSAGLSLGYGDLTLDADSDNKDWSTSYSNYCSEKGYSTKLRQITLSFVQKINTTASNNMLACFMRGGLHVRIVPGARQDTFYLQARMNSTGTSTSAIVESFSVVGGACNGPIKNGYKISTAGVEQLCKRSGKQAIDISLTTDQQVNWDTPRGLSEIPPLQIPLPPQIINIQAKDFVRGTNVAIDQCTTGPGVLANAPPCGPALNAAEFDFIAIASGKYKLDINFAAATTRPVKVTLNGTTVRDQAISETTGGWNNSDLRWSEVGVVELVKGTNTIRLERPDVFPHIHDLRLTPTF